MSNNTIATGTTPKEQVNWVTEKYEEYVRFIAPSGFKFEFNSDSTIFNTILKLNDSSKNAELCYTRWNEVFRINEWKEVVVLNCDPWLNKDFFYGDTIAHTVELHKVLLDYISKYYDCNSSSLL